jgi:uncharacterized protein
MNYTSALNVIFLVVATVLSIRFLRTGGLAMLDMMGMSERELDRRAHGLPVAHEHH